MIPQLVSMTSSLYDLCVGLTSNGDSFLNSNRRIFQPDYLPNDDDIARMQKISCSLEDITINLGRTLYRYMEFDFARPARWNCLSQFGVIDVVAFVVDLATYDEQCSENNAQTGLQQAIALFDDLCKSNRLLWSRIVLSTKNLELFRRKLWIKPLRDYYPQYEGGSDYATAYKYIVNHFQCLADNGLQRKLHRYPFRWAVETSFESVGGLIRDACVSDQIDAICRR